MSEELDETYKRRTLGGVLMLVIPAVTIAIVLFIYLGFVVAGQKGHEPTGAETLLTYQACEEARPLIEQRLAHIGLEDAVVEDAPGGFTIATTLPEDARSAATIPQDLALPGTFAVRPLATPTGEPGEAFLTESDIEFATVVQAFLDTPYAMIQLDDEGIKTLRDHMKAHAQEFLSLSVNGQHVTLRKNMPAEEDGQLQLHLSTNPNGSEATDLDKLYYAASAAMSLEYGPLPCDVRLVGSEPAAR